MELTGSIVVRCVHIWSPGINWRGVTSWNPQIKASFLCLLAVLLNDAAFPTCLSTYWGLRLRQASLRCNQRPSFTATIFIRSFPVPARSWSGVRTSRHARESGAQHRGHTLSHTGVLSSHQSAYCYVSGSWKESREPWGNRRWPETGIEAAVPPANFSPFVAKVWYLNFYSLFVEITGRVHRTWWNTMDYAEALAKVYWVAEEKRSEIWRLAWTACLCLYTPPVSHFTDARLRLT